MEKRICREKGDSLSEKEIRLATRDKKIMANEKNRKRASKH
jgi:hypothetical protein